MSCPAYKKLCDKLVISTGVTTSSDNLIIDIPAGTYLDDGKYCIVVAQTLPSGTTIASPVSIRITGSTATYPLLNPDGTPTYACAINTRTRYTTYVHTGVSTGSFILAGKLPCSQCANNLPSLPVPTVTT